MTWSHTKFDPRPLTERWREKISLLEKIVPAHHEARSWMMAMASEGGLIKLDAVIAQVQTERGNRGRPADYDRPAWVAKRDELQALKNRYHEAWRKLPEAKRRLHPSAVAHEILEDLPIDLDRAWRPIFTGKAGEFPDPTSFAEEKAVVEKFKVEEVDAIETFLHALEDAAANEACTAENNRKLIVALYRRLAKLEVLQALAKPPKKWKSKTITRSTCSHKQQELHQ
jgi:hypothetical protein